MQATGLVLSCVLVLSLHCTLLQGRKNINLGSIFRSSSRDKTTTKQVTEAGTSNKKSGVASVLLSAIAPAVLKGLLPKAVAQAEDVLRQHDEAKLKTLYSEYLVKYNKSASRLDDPGHREMFRQNRNEVLAHNEEYEQGRRTWFKAVNIFTDMSDEEIKSYTGYIREMSADLERSTTELFERSSAQFPNRLDYREEGIVTPIKDQGGCASSFSFATVACVESQYAFLDNRTLSLSEQHILDCTRSSEYGNNGCQGGTFSATFKFMKRFGVATESNYSYEGTDEQECKVEKVIHNNRATSWKRIVNDKNAMKEALVEYGPIIGSIVVNREFMSYGGGVFNAPNTNKSNHAVLIIGYGRENETDFWTIKNSWGEHWGQGGFMDIASNMNLCNIANGAYTITGVFQPKTGVEVSGSAPPQTQNLIQATAYVVAAAATWYFPLYFQ